MYRRDQQGKLDYRKVVSWPSKIKGQNKIKKLGCCLTGIKRLLASWIEWLDEKIK
jgi:hypothetical protein